WLTLNHNDLGGLLYLLAACGLLVLGLTNSFLSRNSITYMLPAGPLRERLFELAEQMRVRVRQAYRLPPAAWRLVNVVGIMDCAHVSAEVLPHLSRREADALLALELARLWRRRRFALWQTLGATTLMLVVAVGLGVLAFFAGEESIWPLMPFAFVVGVLWRLRQSGQHFTSRLDRDALAITGDPEALITALAKLRRLHMLPLVAGEERGASDAPLAEWDRLQDVADRAGIPPERFQEILDGPGSGTDH